MRNGAESFAVAACKQNITTQRYGQTERSGKGTVQLVGAPHIPRSLLGLFGHTVR